MRQASLDAGLTPRKFGLFFDIEKIKNKSKKLIALMTLKGF